jgi:hypothetical protein
VRTIMSGSIADLEAAAPDTSRLTRGTPNASPSSPETN